MKNLATNLRVQEGRSLDNSLGVDECRGSEGRGRSQEESGCNCCELHSEGYGFKWIAEMVKRHTPALTPRQENMKDLVLYSYRTTLL